MARWKIHLLCRASIVGLLAWAGPSAAQSTPAARSAAEIRQQMENLEEELAAARKAEAEAAIEAEEAARTALEQAQQGAAAARAYLASQGEEIEPPPATGSGVTATTTTTHPDNTKVVKVESYSPKGLPVNQTGSQKFGGIDFGVGVSFSYDLGGEHRLKEAELVNGIVRVTEADNARARLILESHYFFTPNKSFPLLGLENTEERKEWGFGPFIALQPGSDAVIDAIGAGLMLGLKRSEEGDDSFNFGVGVLYDMETRVLGDGILANQPLPDGETEIRYKMMEQAGLLFISSYSF